MHTVQASTAQANGPRTLTARARPALAAALSALCIAPSVHAGTRAYGLRIVAYGEQAVPGDPDGAIFDDISPSVLLDDAGRVVFNAVMETPGSSRRYRRMWRDDGGVFRELLRQAQPVPGAEQGVVINAYDTLGPIARDEVVCTLYLAGPTTPEYAGLYRFSEGSLDPIVIEGEPAPGTSGALFERGWTYRFNSAGQVVFRTTLSGSGIDDSNNLGLWISQQGGSGPVTTLRAREGQAAPGFGPGFTIQQINGLGSLRDAGVFTFHATVGAPSGDPDDELECLWLSEPMGLSPIVIGGTQPPGLPAGYTFDRFDGSILSDAGQLFLLGSYKPAAPTSDYLPGLWLGTPNDLQLLAHTGQPAPGLTPGTLLVTFNPVALNASGDAAFFATVEDPGDPDAASRDTSLWIVRNGSIELVARESEPAPDCPPGVRFGQLGVASMNAQGRVLVTANLSGSGVPGDQGIWATDETGTLRLVARVGDELDFDPSPFVDDIRSIEGIEFYGSGGVQHGAASAFSDSGDIAIYANIRGEGTFESAALVASLMVDPACTAADLASPFGELNIDDVLAFLDAFSRGDTDADLVPDGTLDIDDVLVFLGAFAMGC